MTALSDSVNPASRALPSTLSVYSVAKIAVGARQHSATASRVTASNGSRNHAAAAKSTANGTRQPRISSTSRTSWREAGRSISMPTISIEQNAFALENGWQNVPNHSGSVTPAIISTIIST